VHSTGLCPSQATDIVGSSRKNAAEEMILNISENVEISTTIGLTP
jgi:hypothetical protein